MVTQDDKERSTRDRLLRLVVETGPVSVVELAQDLDLTTAGVRRHVAALEEEGKIAVHSVPQTVPAGRGRPARRYVATERAHSALSSTYADLAEEALEFLEDALGPDAVAAFARSRMAAMEGHLASLTADVPDLSARVDALAEALSHEGFASSVRPVPGGGAVQLCQGHCPVQGVASRFPALCEAEAQMFSRLLGVHVQRLSTLAAGGHVCTTHIPTGAVRPVVRARSEGRPEAAVEGVR
ncbi:helix-turn-helix transcriptional regulator [Actinotalea sp.]|uniref:helix-turn-helix transcriptional regulator n=1 Tax=Actinotalea sp. TaxID=1872145 RepID=UPI0035650B92